MSKLLYIPKRGHLVEETEDEVESTED